MSSEHYALYGFMLLYRRVSSFAMFPSPLFARFCVDGDTPVANSVYGTISGATSKLLVYPLDTGKKLLQVYQLNPGKSVKEFLRDHYHLTGVRGLYAGAMAAMLKSGLSSGLLFGFYTLAKTFLNYRVCKTNPDKL